MLEESPEKTGKQRTSPRPGCARRAFKAVAVAVAVVLGALYIAERAAPREKARATSCLSNIKQIGLGMQMYASEHDDRLPRTLRWEAQIYPYLKNRQLFSCPGDPYGDIEGETRYAMVPRFGGVKIETRADATGPIIAYDSDASGHPEPRHTRPRPGAHGLPYWWGRLSGHGVNCAFMDGHAKWMAGIPDQIATGPYAAPISEDDGFWRDP